LTYFYALATNNMLMTHS